MFHSTRLILSRPSAAIFGSTQGVKTSYGHNEEVYQITLQDGSNYICTREGAPLLAHWGFMDQYHHFNPNSDGRQETFSLIPIQHKKDISDFVLPLKSDSLQDPWDVRALDEASRRFVGNIKHIQRGYIKQASEDFRKRSFRFNNRADIWEYSPTKHRDCLEAWAVLTTSKEYLSHQGRTAEYNGWIHGRSIQYLESYAEYLKEQEQVEASASDLALAMNTASQGAHWYTPSPHGYGRYYGGAEDRSASDRTNHIQAGEYSIPRSANSLSYYDSSSHGPLEANVYPLPHQLQYQQNGSGGFMYHQQRSELDQTFVPQAVRHQEEQEPIGEEHVTRYIDEMLDSFF